MKRDLYGRTVDEIRAAIAHNERLYAISSTYGGNEGLALKLAMRRANLDVDRRALAELEGAKIPEEFRPAPLSGDALRKFREQLTYFHHHARNRT